uniref:Uncharacterized protein n=1 Tax=Stegastes partitus TaxID=144197 RepID=A0A3B5B348_9TELE
CNCVALDPPLSQSAVSRLANLPVVRSACAKLSVLYTDTKCSHPSLRSVCDMLENSVIILGSAALHRFSPVIVKLEPQIAVANGVACKSLDWLEASFPILVSPTEQVTFLFIFQILKSPINCTFPLKD